MSDVMLCGVLRMPKELWADPFMLMQIQSRALEAADELERRADEIEQQRMTILDLDAVITERATEIERLRAALEPFAKMADQVDEWQKGADPHVNFEFSADALRRARTAIEKSTP